MSTARILKYGSVVGALILSLAGCNGNGEAARDAGSADTRGAEDTPASSGEDGTVDGGSGWSPDHNPYEGPRGKRLYVATNGGNLLSVALDTGSSEEISRGELVWSYGSLASYSPRMAVGPEGHVHTTSSLHLVRKYDDSGRIAWSVYEKGTGGIDIAVGSDGNVYVAANESVIKFGSSGEELWRFDDGGLTPDGLTVDGSGDVYAVGEDQLFVKIDASGEKIWAYEESSADRPIVADARGNLYTSSVGSVKDFYKFDSEGERVWSFFDEKADDITDVAVGPEGNAYLASEEDSSDLVRKISSAGDGVWNYDGHERGLAGLTVGADGRVYTGDYEGVVKRVDPSGEEVWSTELQGDCRGVVGGSSGEIYVGVVREEGVGIREVGESGESEWFDAGHRGAVRDLTSDARGNVYTASKDETVRKVDPTGREIWTFDDPNSSDFSSGFSVAVDSEENVYSGWGDRYVRKIGPNGDQFWEYDTGAGSPIYDVGVGPDGNVFAVGGFWVGKLSSEGEEIWSFESGDTAYEALAVDRNGNVYAGSRSGPGQATGVLAKFSSSGEEQWSKGLVDGEIREVRVGAEGLVHAATDGSLVTVSPEDGTEQERMDTSGAPFLIREGKVFHAESEEGVLAQGGEQIAELPRLTISALAFDPGTE